MQNPVRSTRVRLPDTTTGMQVVAHQWQALEATQE